MPEHANATDPQVHEPKGITTAVNGTTYVADGAGSGAWEKIQGWGNYQDTNTTVGTPTQVLATGVQQDFICDGGTLTLERLPSDATVPLWDVATNRHIAIAENDTYFIRASFIIENYAGTSPYLTMVLDIGGGPGVIYEQTIPLLRSGAAQAVSFTIPVFTGSTYIVNDGALKMTYVGTGTADVYKNTIQIDRLSRNG